MFVYPILHNLHDFNIISYFCQRISSLNSYQKGFNCVFIVLDARRIEKAIKEMSENTPKYYLDPSYYVNNLLQCKSTKFNAIFGRRLLRKLRRDQLNIQKTNDYQSTII